LIVIPDQKRRKFKIVIPDQKRKKDRDRIVFGSDVQYKITIFVSCLVWWIRKNKIYKKIILPLICIVVELTYFKKKIVRFSFALVYIEC